MLNNDILILKLELIEIYCVKRKYMNNAEQLIELLLSYFSVNSISQLADKMNTTQATISNWKIRNSFNAIKKKCRELGIYDEIFTQSNIQSIHSINGGQNAQNIFGNQVVENEIKNEFDSATFELFKEAYTDAVKENKLKEFRLYLMDF